MILWFQLARCLGVIGIAGWHLSRNGDIIAEKTGLLAMTAAEASGVAVGDLLGSAVFNLLILLLLDALYLINT